MARLVVDKIAEVVIAVKACGYLEVTGQLPVVLGLADTSAPIDLRGPTPIQNQQQKSRAQQG